MVGVAREDKINKTKDDSIWLSIPDFEFYPNPSEQIKSGQIKKDNYIYIFNTSCFMIIIA